MEKVIEKIRNFPDYVNLGLVTCGCQSALKSCLEHPDDEILKNFKIKIDIQLNALEYRCDQVDKGIEPDTKITENFNLISESVSGIFHRIEDIKREKAKMEFDKIWKRKENFRAWITIIIPLIIAIGTVLFNRSSNSQLVDRINSIESRLDSMETKK